MAHGTSPPGPGNFSGVAAEPARRSTRPGLWPPARPGRPAPAGSGTLEEEPPTESAVEVPLAARVTGPDQDHAVCVPSQVGEHCSALTSTGDH